MEFTFWNTFYVVIIISFIGNCIVQPICNCIFKCYKIKHTVFKVEKEYEKPKDFQDVDYR